MADETSAAGGFEFYEGIRIVVPGGVAVGLMLLATRSFTALDIRLEESLIGASVASLFAGLLLYFVDVPSRSAAYRHGLPSKVLSGWAKNGLGPPLNTFFLIQDEDMPANLRTRSQYMGAIFRIGYEAIHLVALATVAAFDVMALRGWGRSGGRGGSAALDATLWAAVALIVGIAALTLWFEHVQRTPEPRPSELNRWDAVLLLLTSSGAVLALTVVPGRRAAAASVAAVSTLGYAHWAFRYHRGWRRSDAPYAGRRSAVALLVAPLAASVANVAHNGPGPVQPPSVVAWTLLALVPLVLIAARGHERRLYGGYGQQREWLRLNQQALEWKYR